MKTPFRYDFVGSFLRPQRLKDARKDFEEGKITQADLTKVEDECIVDLVNKIKGLGYHVITDGEFRRSTWHLDFMWGFEGIEHQKTVEGNTTFDAEAAMIDDTYMTGKISVKNHPFVEHFKYVKALEGTKTRVLDTRKTTPGMRMMEKDAVKIGGGVNHRIGLFDMILLKDNHVDFAGGIEQAITRAQNYLKEKGKNLKIEIEVRNFDELQQAMNVGGIDRIMLDNFNIEDTKKAVEMIGGRYETESSGGITFDTLRDYAECGVDFISVGALTHSVKSLDMSLKAC